jgi:preprotein translocase subunit SecG
MIFPDITLFFLAVAVLSVVIAVLIHRRKSRDR